MIGYPTSTNSAKQKNVCRLKFILTLRGEFSRSAYLLSAELRVNGPGNGGGSDPLPPPKTVPSSASAWREKTVSRGKPRSLAASSTFS